MAYALRGVEKLVWRWGDVLWLERPNDRGWITSEWTGTRQVRWTLKFRDIEERGLNLRDAKNMLRSHRIMAGLDPDTGSPVKA